MTRFDLKILAIITMVIDHIGAFFFPHLIVLRILGRLSFPIFAWLVGTGAVKTKNIDNYLARLALFAFISQIPFYFAFSTIGYSMFYANVIFTLFFGLLSIKIYKLKIRNIRLIVMVMILNHIYFIKQMILLYYKFLYYQLIERN